MDDGGLEVKIASVSFLICYFVPFFFLNNIDTAYCKYQPHSHINISQ